jgi:hypothetical protein
MSSRASEKLRLPLWVKMRSFTGLPMAVIVVRPATGPLIVSVFWATGIAPVLSVIVLHAEVSTVLLFAAVAMMPRKVPAPLSPQSVTDTAKASFASAQATTMDVASSLRLARASAVESDIGLSHTGELRQSVGKAAVESP